MGNSVLPVAGIAKPAGIFKLIRQILLNFSIHLVCIKFQASSYVRMVHCIGL